MSVLPAFDNEMVLRFVRNYRENQCLWDWNSPSYKNKAARDEAYENLVIAMDIPGFTVLDVKNKIKNIRSTYCQELKKIHTARMLGREPYVPSVFWFKELDSFLHSNTTPRTDFGDRKVPKYLTKFHNLPPQKNAEEAQPDFYFQQCPSADETNNSYPEPPDGEMPLFVQQDSIISLAEEPPSSEISEPVSKKRKRDKDDEDDFTGQMRRRMVMRYNPPMNTEDEFELFGRSVAVQLKKMTICTALTVQAKIQQLLSQHRIDDIKKRAEETPGLCENNAEGSRNVLRDLVNEEEEHMELPVSPQLSLHCGSETSDNENTEVA